MKCTVLLLADNGWTENNGKIGLAGIFERINIPELPSTILPFSIFLRLEALEEGQNLLSVILKDKKSDIINFTINVGFENNKKSNFSQLVLKTPPCSILSYGEYSIILKSQEKEIFEFPLIVEK